MGRDDHRRPLKKSGADQGEGRASRVLTGKQFFVATVSKGCEETLAEELASFGLSVPQVGAGAVRIEGELEAGYRACLWSRVASRILLEVGSFPARSTDALYDGIKEINWLAHLDPEGTLAVDFVGQSEAIRDSRFGSMRVKDAIVDQMRERTGLRPSVDLKTPDVRINVHLAGGEATVAIDLSGAPLHRRGGGRDGGPAPLKETLAAAILRMAGWPEAAAKGLPLVDPMCGSGTFLIEAVGMAKNIAPGLKRKRWGFQRWRGHDAALWKFLYDEAREAVLDDVPLVFGSDRDPKQIQRTLDNAARSGLEDLIRVHVCELEDAQPPPGQAGIVVTNPPYGERLMGDEAEVYALYRGIGDVLKRRYLGWTGWILAGSPKLGRQFGLKPKRKIALWNGGIDCRLVMLPISDHGVARDNASSD